MKYRLKINILTCSLPLSLFPFQKPAVARPRPKKVGAGKTQRKGAASSTGGGGGGGGGGNSSGTAVPEMINIDESQEADDSSSAPPSSSPSSLQAYHTRGPKNDRILNCVAKCLAVQLEKA